MTQSGSRHQKHIVVIGGGLAGLTASYDLARSGHRVTILEDKQNFGGLASSIHIDGQPVERFYHFVCRADRHLIQLVSELGIRDQLYWKQTRTSFYHNGRLYPFGTPPDLLRFSAVPWFQRLRFGIHVMHSRYRSQWKWLDQIPAKPWLIENIGEQAYNVIWHPLLRVKFGDYYDKISAAWIWHRIWRVATSRRFLWGREMFGYLERGSATLVETLLAWLRVQPDVSLRTGARVQTLQTRKNKVTGVCVDDQSISCDVVISTVSLPILDQLLSQSSSPYLGNTRQIDYIGVVCMLLNLKHSFSPSFWMNINDPRISFNGVIEQTNLNQHLCKAGFNIVYIPFYLPTNQPRYHFSDEKLFSEYVQLLTLINPAFDEIWIKEWHIFRDPYAQAICTTNFAELIPALASPIRGLYVTDSTQFYPEDRTVSAAIQQGRKAAQMILESN